jgi:CO/xanthine dehydrogenase Mo-binding subunit
MQKRSQIGKPAWRKEGKAVVTGKLKYASDLSFPDMLYGKTHRCPFPFAKVIAINTKKAWQSPGVVTVVTAKDIKGINLHGYKPFVDQPVLIGEGDIARMIGDPIAVIGAESEEAAQEAAALIEVEYEEFIPILNPENVVKSPKDFLVHDTAFCGDYDYEKGDVELGVEEADFIAEEKYLLPLQEHAYLETESVVAVPESDGTLQIIGCTQDPHYLRHEVARSLGISENSVRVIVLPMGGAFGGKEEITVHTVAAIIALKTNRPAKMVWSREESMVVSTKRHSGRFFHRLGATKEGKITFMEVDYLLDAGAYAATSPGVVEVMGMVFPGPYKIANISVHGKAVYTNNPIAGSCRGFGAPQAATVTELQVDRLAKMLQIDPIKFRMMNFYNQEDEPGIVGLTNDSKVSSPEVLRKAIEKAGPPLVSLSGSKKVGRGVASAMGFFDSSSVPISYTLGTGASIELFRDGIVEVQTGVVEMGTGITTVVAQIASEVLGVSLDDVKVIFADTQRTVKQGPTLGSRSAYCTGNAVKMAAEELRTRLVSAAEQSFNIPSDRSEFVFAENQITSLTTEEVITLIDLAEFCYENGINTKTEGWFISTHAEAGHSPVAAVIDVEVDTDTGEVDVRNCVISHDSGKILNPLNARAQLIGAGLMGIGYALMENMVTVGGNASAENLHDYLIPTSMDVPNIEALFIEEPNPTGPYGARGLGEHGVYVTAPALLIAVANAVGKQISAFPLTHQRVYDLIHEVSSKTL